MYHRRAENSPFFSLTEPSLPWIIHPCRPFFRHNSELTLFPARVTPMMDAHTDNDDRIGQWPLPLAQLYRRARNALDPLERHQAAYYGWEAAVKLTAVSAIAEALGRGSEVSGHDCLKPLARPSLGHWWGCCKTLLPLLGQNLADPYQPLADALVGRASQDLPAVAALDTELSGRNRSGRVRLFDLFERLVAERNDHIGHGAVGMKSKEFYFRRASAFLEAMAELLTHLDLLAGGRLVYVSHVGRDASGRWVVEQLDLVGETPRRREPNRVRQGAEGLPVPGRVYLNRPRPDAPPEGPPPLTSLHPLVVYDEARWRVAFLNRECKGDGGEYLDYVDSQQLPRKDLAKELREFLGQIGATSVQEPPARAVAAAAPAGLVAESSPAARRSSLRVALLYKRNAQPDEELLQWLERALTASGAEVFIDRHISIGVEWAQELEKQLQGADAVVPLLSASSIHSEMLAFEVRVAHDEAQKRGGRPRLLPVRVGFEGPLPPELAAVLDRLQYFLWRGPADNTHLRDTLLTALDVPPPPPPAPLPVGTLPLDYAYYVERTTDADFQATLARRDSIVLLRGARQMGKTSLLIRGLRRAREAGCRVVLADFQRFNNDALASIDLFYRTLAQWLADDLDLSSGPEDDWSERRSPNDNFQRFLRRKVLQPTDTHLVLALDEVDRLFGCPFATEVFGLLRSWHTLRNIEPAWQRLTLVISYATEAYLFITDLNQSPFNVGTLIPLEDFTLDQVRWLNGRYGSPLCSPAELDTFVRLVGGHPHLVNRGLYQLSQRGLPSAGFEAEAARSDGMFGDHLRRLVVVLARNPGLCDVVRAVLRGRPCPTAESFHRLRSAGVLAGDSHHDARPRCELYSRYLERHLP